MQQLNGSKPPLTSNDLVFAWSKFPHDDWLQQTMLADRLGQLLNLGLVKNLPGLVLVGHDGGNRNLNDLIFGFAGGSLVLAKAKQ